MWQQESGYDFSFCSARGRKSINIILYVSFAAGLPLRFLLKELDLRRRRFNRIRVIVLG